MKKTRAWIALIIIGLFALIGWYGYIISTAPSEWWRNWRTVTTIIILSIFLIVLAVAIIVSVICFIGTFRITHEELPKIIPLKESIRNYIKRPRTKKQIVSIAIFLLLIIPLFVLWFYFAVRLLFIEGGFDMFFMTLAFPLFGLMFVVMLISLDKKGAVKFFTDYYDFKLEPDFEPTGKSFDSVVFTENGIQITREQDQTILPYEKIELSAYAAYRSSGSDLMRVYVLIKKIGYDNQIRLRLNQELYNYLKYYNMEITALDEIIANRTELMNRNCKPTYMFYFWAAFGKKQ